MFHKDQSLDLHFFVLYTASLSTDIEKYADFHHSYADDSQLQKSALPHQIPHLFLSMQKNTDDVKTWMTVNKLKLNDRKTEAVSASSGRKSWSLSSYFPNSMVIGSAFVPALSDSFKILSVTTDCHLTMKTPISNLVRSTTFKLRRFSSIGHLLSTEVTKTIVFAFCFHALTAGIPSCLTVLSIS